MSKTRAQIKDDLIFWWGHRSDIFRGGLTRSEIEAEYPEVLRAWDNLKLAETTMDAVIAKLENEPDA